MKKYILPAIITCLLVITHVGVTDMKAMTDNELNSVTGQAGITGFNEAFSNTAGVNQEIKKKVFDQVFVKNDLETASVTVNQTSFDEAHVNKMALNFTEATEQKLNMNIHMDEITFAQAFDKVTGVDTGLDKTVLNDVKMKDLNIKVRGDARIRFN